MTTSSKFIAYYRVSTAAQGQSGLGLEAQREAVRVYLAGKGWPPIDEFVEIETGKGANALAKRPQLMAAITAAKRHKATLVIARLDRLARNVHFISGLMETGVDFIAVDNPHASPFELHIRASMSQEEARLISERTKAALRAAKARGTQLGSHGAVLAARHRKAAKAQAMTYAPLVRLLRADGLMSTRQLAEALNERGIASPGGGRWHPSSAHKLIHRLSAET